MASQSGNGTPHLRARLWIKQDLELHGGWNSRLWHRTDWYLRRPTLQREIFAPWSNNSVWRKAKQLFIATILHGRPQYCLMIMYELCLHVKWPCHGARRPGFYPRSVHVTFKVDTVLMKLGFLPVLWPTPIGIIPPVRHTLFYLKPTLCNFSIWQRRYTTHFKALYVQITGNAMTKIRTRRHRRERQY